MTISQPSLPIYVIDVPEVRGFHVTYRYNFFTPDESVNETGGVPSAFLTRAGDEIDSSFIQYSTTRAPRYVVFRWSKPTLADVGNVLSEQAHRDHTFRTTGEQNGSLILDNVHKVVSEDDFATNHYASVHFHDGEIDDKIHELVSGSFTVQSLHEPTDPHVSHARAAGHYSATMPAHIRPHLIFKSMTMPKKSGGATYYTPAGSSDGHGKKGAARPKASSRYVNTFFERLKEVTTNTQINVKFMHDLVNRSIRDPGSTNANDLVNMHSYSKQAKQATNQRRQLAISEGDYRSYVPYFWVRKHGTSPHVQKYGAEIVGFIIDKFEVTKNGSLKAHAPIVIDNPHVNTTADYRVKFNAKYCYTIRTVALLTMPALEEVTGEVATVKVLVSSKPSNKVYLSTLKLDAPPPPSDVNFVWNYETNRMLVTWAFPITSERDIKQFQVFRRQRVDHSFELQKQYNFDDSVVKFPYNEVPDARLVEHLRSPATFWTDDEFNWDVHTTEDKGLIYAVTAIDAHGQTSGYSAQYKVWFDRFKNKLQKKLVSHIGAPKPYPNLYMEGSLFENTIRVAGPHSKRMKLYFNPDFYYYTDDRGRTTQVVQTKQVGGSYKLQFINLDNMKSADLDITIDDRTTHTTQKRAQPTHPVGPQRRPQRSA